MWLGLDVGASKTAWTLVDRGGVPHRGRLDRGVQVGVLGVGRGTDALRNVLVEVLGGVGQLLGVGSQVTATVVAVAGAGDSALREALTAGVADVPGVGTVRVVGDVEAAAMAALGGNPGVAVWSGTGSFAVAVGPAGTLHRVGGRGYLLSDAGSGFDLVRRAAAAAVAAEDGLGPPTALGDALRDAFAAPRVERLGAVLQGLSSAQVAARSGLVVDAAAAGDAVAEQILAAATDALLHLGEAACRRAQLDPAASRWVLGGGLLTAGSPMSGRVGAALAAKGYGGEVRPLAGAASDGAARLARELGSGRGTVSGAWFERGPA